MVVPEVVQGSRAAHTWAPRALPISHTSKPPKAMAMAPTDQAEPNTVMQVVQKGYVLNERLIRPAKVIVAQAPPPPAR